MDKNDKSLAIGLGSLAVFLLTSAAGALHAPSGVWMTFGIIAFLMAIYAVALWSGVSVSGEKDRHSAEAHPIATRAAAAEGMSGWVERLSQMLRQRMLEARVKEGVGLPSAIDNYGRDGFQGDDAHQHRTLQIFSEQFHEEGVALFRQAACFGVAQSGDVAFLHRPANARDVWDLGRWFAALGDQLRASHEEARVIRPRSAGAKDRGPKAGL